MRLIARLVEVADLGGDIRLEEAVADDEQQKAEEEKLRHHQREFADGHDGRADDRRCCAGPSQRSAMKPPIIGVRYTNDV